MLRLTDVQMKKTVAVFFGGKSTEHDISIITAVSSIMKPLEASGKYVVIPVYISKKGTWHSDDRMKEIGFFRSKEIKTFCAKDKSLQVSFDGGMTIKKAGLRSKPIRIDIAFPAMHGPYGEDGSLMGLLRLAGIPFVGSDMEASVIAMDKVLAKQVAKCNGIPTSKFVFFSRSECEDNLDSVIIKITSELAFPLFVKPAHLGSSIGITKVETENELENAIEVAVHYDAKIIIEEAVPNLIEVTVPIMGNTVLQPALVEQPLIQAGDFFDFETKYMNGGKKGKHSGSDNSGSQGYSNLPADISKELYESALDTAISVFKATDASGISRVDLLIDTVAQIVYFNELNPLPGSLYAHNWRKSGVSGIELVSRLIEYAEQRHAKNQQSENVFSTSFLQQF